MKRVPFLVHRWRFPSDGPAIAGPPYGGDIMEIENPVTEGERLPGLFRTWELGRILTPGQGYRIERAGETRDGTRLLAVFRCTRPEGASG